VPVFSCFPRSISALASSTACCLFANTNFTFLCAAEQASQLGCAYPPADADADTGAEPPRWHRQRLSKIRCGDCTAVAGLWYSGDATGFSVGTHYWEISSSLLPQHPHGETSTSLPAAADRPSFAVGLVSSDRLPGKIFLGSEPSSGSLGYGFAYLGRLPPGLGSRPALLSTGCEPREYGAPFAAGDTVGLLLDCEKREISFFVNDEPQGVAFSGDDLKEITQPLRPAVALSRPGVQIEIRHKSGPGVAAHH
jgi:hypothetical protein